MARTGRTDTRKLTRLALLTAAALALGWAERFIPNPMMYTGVKLGLANTVLLYALYLLDVKSAVVLMLLKVFLSGFAYAGVNAMLYSLAGGAASLAMMILVKGLSRGTVSLVGVSMVGAVFHNAGQLLVVAAVASWRSAVVLSPLLLISGVLMGLTTGVIGKYAIGALEKIEGARPSGGVEK